LAGPPALDDYREALRINGAPPEVLAQFPATEKVRLWACNAPVLSVLQCMPWVPGFNGPAGLDWSQLPRVAKECRVRKRRDLAELPGLLRQCEAWVFDVLEERREAERRK